MTERTNRPRRRSRLRLVLSIGGGVLLGLVILFVGFVSYAYYLLRQAPEGWQQVEAARVELPPAYRAEIASSAERRVVEALSFTAEIIEAYQSGQPPAFDQPLRRTVTLTNQEINAWLEGRLPLWIENQGMPWPKEVSDLRYWVEDGRPVVGFRYTTPDIDQVVSVGCDLVIDPDGGDARFQFVQLRGGRLPLPLDRFKAPTLRQLVQSEPQAQRLAEVLDGTGFDPIYPVDERRQARLVEWRAEPEQVVLTFETEPRR